MQRKWFLETFEFPLPHKMMSISDQNKEDYKLKFRDHDTFKWFFMFFLPPWTVGENKKGIGFMYTYTHINNIC